MLKILYALGMNSGNHSRDGAVAYQRLTLIILHFTTRDPSFHLKHTFKIKTRKQINTSTNSSKSMCPF